jgi:hypothetical protein
MPRIFDNINLKLLPALKATLAQSTRSDFCVGYFNLRGWKAIDSMIEQWPGDQGGQCRLLVGMQPAPHDELRQAMSLNAGAEDLDQQTAHRLKKQLAEDFRNQLKLGAPNDEDEAGLRRLVWQLKSKKLVVKLFLKHSLHAKLYLCYRSDINNPITGFVGSSNLTFSGLASQGELNVDVLDHDASDKLAQWFDARWTERWCVDITAELIQVIEESWAREELIPPYHIYVKMAYHLAQEARAGLSEFSIPKEFGNRLFDFQVAAVKIAAHHLNKRGGVLIGDVVGLGKTLMATALAKVFQDDQHTETLIICPKNLVKMWEDYVGEYRLLAKVLPLSLVARDLPAMRRYKVVLIDESHNLRNREGKQYAAIQDYIQKNDSLCILLSATPYNKTYHDLSSQLRIFIPEEKDLGIRPEQLIRSIGETEFLRRHQCPIRSLAAFEKSESADDWRELMRLFMVRRTRSFIQANYATFDHEKQLYFLTFEDGKRAYFPKRVPKTVKVNSKRKDNDDQYARLYAQDVVDDINSLNLPRYGLANYVADSHASPPTAAESQQLSNLTRAGKRMMGFCRTNLFKRLESSGEAFLLSVRRHIQRNLVFLYAIENGLPLPIGSMDAGQFDTGSQDEDPNDINPISQSLEADIEESETDIEASDVKSDSTFAEDAKKVYEYYCSRNSRSFRWISARFFTDELAADLRNDAEILGKLLERCGTWRPSADVKLAALCKLLTETHPNDKVIIFTQFADTVRYLSRNLQERGIVKLEGVTGKSTDPTELAWRFSPGSNKTEYNKNEQAFRPENELRVLIATDVLSEGQNLQDAAVIVNYDLPWAIIRLMQRAGRVDRIGQQAETILCYSFLPADGIEQLIQLRSRVRQRLEENREVIGTDEAFFQDEREIQDLRDLYNEKSGILDGEADTEVDLASYAYQIWKNATQDPAIKPVIEKLPEVVFSTKEYSAAESGPGGVLVYLRTAEGNDALTWMDAKGNAVTQSQFEILRAAECAPDTPALPRRADHHSLVAKGAEHIVAEEKTFGGQLGRPSGARFRTYEKLKRYAEHVKGTLYESSELVKAIDEIYHYPLRQAATDTINRQLRLGITDENLAELVTALRNEDRLCVIHETDRIREPQIICSLGLRTDATH